MEKGFALYHWCVSLSKFMLHLEKKQQITWLKKISYLLKIA